VGCYYRRRQAAGGTRFAPGSETRQAGGPPSSARAIIRAARAAAAPGRARRSLAPPKETDGDGAAETLLNGYLRRRFAWLFAALLLTIGLEPVIEAIGPDANVMGVVLAMSLFAAIASAARERAFRIMIGSEWGSRS